MSHSAPTPQQQLPSGIQHSTANKRPLAWLTIFLLIWLLSAAFEPAQAFGYYLLVELGAVRRSCPAWILDSVVTLGSPSVTAAALLSSVVIGLYLRRGRQTLYAVTAASCMLIFASIAPRLGLYTDHGWFPHEPTFPSGHMTGFLASCLVLTSVTSHRPWKLKLAAGTGLLGCLLGIILSVTAHTVWDVLGSTALFLVVLSFMPSRSTS